MTADSEGGNWELWGKLETLKTKRARLGRGREEGQGPGLGPPHDLLPPRVPVGPRPSAPGLSLHVLWTPQLRVSRTG